MEVKEALLGELEQLRQNLTSEMSLRQQYADELASLQADREVRARTFSANVLNVSQNVLQSFAGLIGLPWVMIILTA